jgi:alpha-L-fucosidase
MKISRRTALGLLGVAGAAPWRRARATQIPGIEIAKGPFQPTRDSLRSYTIPQWFHDAKFGIWAHWGPQSAPEQGDWYARRMYDEGSPVNKWHVQHFGHPSKVGYKDVIPTFKGEKFDPENLVGAYKRAGAKYFMSMGVHHDNFNMWNSPNHRWNAVAMGPKKDVVGLFQKAATKRGLRFGVSEHLWLSYRWFALSHGSDTQGPYKGVPYDGADPRYADLYYDAGAVRFANSKTLSIDYQTEASSSYEEGTPDSFRRMYLERIKDLHDRYQPDLWYADGPISFEDYGLTLLANYYNLSARKHGGKAEGVFFSKRTADCAAGTCALDVERGIVDTIWPEPYQTDTCLGNWHYKRDITYKSTKTIVDMLVDVVSRNGNLLLNIPLPGSGEPDDRELKILSEITDWMDVNGEAIFATRPWKISGTTAPSQPARGDVSTSENRRRALTADDVRFTVKGKTLYAFLMGWPDGETTIKPLALDSGKIANVEMLGFKGKLQWSQDETGLKVAMPPTRPCDHAVALRIA